MGHLSNSPTEGANVSIYLTCCPNNSTSFSFSIPALWIGDIATPQQGQLTGPFRTQVHIHGSKQAFTLQCGQLTDFFVAGIDSRQTEHFGSSSVSPVRSILSGESAARSK